MAAPVLAQPLLLGMMRLLEYPELGEPQALLSFIERCVERGLTGFDHADIYAGGRCEAYFGAACAGPGLRQHLQIIGKADIVPAAQDCSRWRVKHYDTSARYLRRAVDDSLARLGVERLDGFLLHRPDPLLQVDEVAETLNALVASGKVGWVGLSNAGILHCRTGPVRAAALQPDRAVTAGPALGMGWQPACVAGCRPAVLAGRRWAEDASVSACAAHSMKSPPIWAPRPIRWRWLAAPAARPAVADPRQPALGADRGGAAGRRAGAGPSRLVLPERSGPRA